MDRKLTDKEVVFLQELRELIAKRSVVLGVENERVSFDVGYLGGEDVVEPIVLPEALTVFYDLDEFIEQNS